MDVERAGDRVADPDPEHVDRALGRPVADEVVGLVGGADHRRDRALEGAEDLAHPDLVGSPRELVAAAGAAGGHDEAGVPEARDELLEVGARQVLVDRDLREARGPGPVAPPELHHEPDAVLALRAEGDGAGSVEGRARGQGSVLVGRSDCRCVATSAPALIPSDFVGIESSPGPPERQRRAKGRAGARTDRRRARYGAGLDATPDGRCGRADGGRRLTSSWSVPPPSTAIQGSTTPPRTRFVCSTSSLCQRPTGD